LAAASAAQSAASVVQAGTKEISAKVIVLFFCLIYRGTNLDIISCVRHIGIFAIVRVIKGTQFLVSQILWRNTLRD